MNWWWFAAAMVVWAVSAVCIVGTIVEIALGKPNAMRDKGTFWGGIAFHGATAVLALWLFLKALGKA